MPFRKVVWARRLVLAVVVGLGLYFSRGVVLPAAGRWLDVGERPRKVDGVLVLPGDESTRPFAAAAWVRRKLADRVLLIETQQPPHPGHNYIAPHEVARRVLAARGVRPGQIELLPAASDSTQTDVEAFRRWLDRHPGATVAIVTNDFHTRRTRSVFRSVLGERARQVLVVGVPTDYVGPDNWWKSREGNRTYLTEFVKLGYYELRYGWGVLWLSLAAGGAAVWGYVRRRKKSVEQRA